MKNPVANRRQQRARRARLHKINSAIVREDKRLGCSFCPRTNLPPEDIHYDHVDPRTKVDCISNLLWDTTEKLLDEMGRCRRICIHCHEERHRWEQQLAKGGISHD